MKKLILFIAFSFAVMPVHARELQQPANIGTDLAPVNGTLNVGAFPNPTNGPFFLEYDLDSEAEVLVEVFNLLGQVVYSETSTRNPGHQLHPVDPGDQATGVYFIRCTIKAPSGTTTLTSKVTLSR